MESSGSAYLKDIDEKFCQCPICLQQYREPKLLPCLHRYCSDCFKQLLERNQDASVMTCPECRDEIKIPREGVDGFKTDFYMKNIIEYIQLHKSLESEKLVECCDCSKTVTVEAYCFKCSGLLCKDCHESHMTKRSLKEHKQHTLSLEDMRSQHMTIEKLTDLKEAPRCQSHLNDLCLLCCRTCNDLPICVTCVHGRHKNHDINDIEIIAAEEREKLKHGMENLNKCKAPIMKMPEIVGRVRTDIISYYRKRKTTFTTKYERNMQKTKKAIEKFEEEYRLSQIEVENNKEKELTETMKQMEEEIKHVKMKYTNMFDEIEKKSRVKLDNLRKVKEKNVENSSEKLAIFERDFSSSMDTFAKEQEDRLVGLEEISHQIVSIIGRYENLIATGHRFLKIKNDWTALQCIPDLWKAIEPLMKDMKKEFPELKVLSRIGVSVDIEEDDESPVNIDVMKRDGWDITSITGASDGGIVITGPVSSTSVQSHITVFKIIGGVITQIQLGSKYGWTNRYCACLSEFKIATVCWKDEIGVFDLRDSSYTTKHISDIISNRSLDLRVRCVTTDLFNNHVLVGLHNTRDVYVFDDQLNYHHKLKLPEIIKCPYDMEFSEGKLIVCDDDSKGAYVVTMEGRRWKLTHEMPKPDCDRDDWDPLSVCTDSNGFIYILWMTGNSLSAGKRVIVQYTQDGRQSLTQKQIDSNDARCITTVETNHTNSLLVGCWTSGKLHIYSLT